MWKPSENGSNPIIAAAMGARGKVAKMLLAIDVGNTQTVIGVYDGAAMRHMWRIATNKKHTSDELRLKLLPLLQSEGVEASALTGAALASVVPQLTSGWRAALRKLTGTEPLACTADSAGPELFPTAYSNPAEIGADRVADAVAARALYGSPVVVVDFGTATNIEVIDRDGVFVGGVIAPGVETSAAALFSHANRLSAIELADPHTAIGDNTAHAIQAGIVYGETDRVDGLVNRIFEQLGYRATVVATGGLAPRVAPLSKTIDHVNPQLTLEGLRRIYEARG